MKAVDKILTLYQGDILIEKLQLAGYAFAAWKMPQSETIQLIISLEEPIKIENFQLYEVQTGFIINEFSDNHPVQPFHISADIILKDEAISINPNVASSKVDEFVSKLESATSNKIDYQSIPNKASNRFEEIVKEAITEIKAGSFEKIVLSRYNDEILPDDFSAWTFFQKIYTNYENAFCSISHIPGKGLWIGASPETLICDTKRIFKTVSLAGTKKLEEGQPLSEIAWTQKEIEEQAFVSRYIINCFKKIRLREFHEHGPKTIKAGNLAHLKTEFIVDYEELAYDNLADQMLSLLHPTSAVCGMPIERSKPWIKEKEGYDRSFYSGFLGPVNYEQATNLFVNLRCVRIENANIRFYAGAGITEDSVPEREYQETEMKMNVLKSLL